MRRIGLQGNEKNLIGKKNLKNLRNERMRVWRGGGGRVGIGSITSCRDRIVVDVSMVVGVLWIEEEKWGGGDIYIEKKRCFE